MKRFLFSLLLTLPLLLPARDNGRFRHYTTEDGLPQNSVYCMAIDKQGFMWVGTADGLCRYDGYHFTIFRPDPTDSSTISNNVIRCMLVDHTGKLWVGTRDGLNCYDPLTGKFKRFYAKAGDKHSLTANTILALAEDASGNIWTTPLNEGVCIYDRTTGKFRQLRHSDNDPASICSDDVRGFVSDKKGHMWISTWGHGVCEYDIKAGKSIFHIPAEKLGTSISRGALCCDKQGRIWIGTWMDGVDIWDPASGKLYHESENTSVLPNMKTGMVWNITEDSRGRIFIATAEQGLVMFDPSTGKYRKFEYDPDDPLALNDKSVWTVCEDHSGQIWMGTWRGGINILDERMERFELLRFDPRDSNSLPAATAWGICSDSRNGLWIGTAAGPVHYDPATKKFWQPPLYPKDEEAPPPNCDIQALTCDKKGNVWMGSAGNGVFVYDTTAKKFRHYRYIKGDPKSIGGEIVNAICVDEHGEVWTGSGYGPLQRYDAQLDGFVTYPFDKADSLASGIVTIVAEGKNKLLLGLITGDVFRFDTQTKKYTRLWKNTTAIGVSSIYPDKFGGIWIGTNGSGLVYLKDNSPVWFTEKDSLPNNVVNAIIPGAHDELWLASNHGLTRFDPISRSIRGYTPEDGLQGNEFNQGAVARTPDGKLWFGGVKGVSAFYPKSILPNLAPAPVVITAFTVLNKPFALPQNIAFTKDISLTYRDYFFSFDFAGLEFTNSSRNRYKYMMEGFDADWIDAGTRRYATYTNLDPGEYTFRVMASNNDGYWSNNVTEIHLTISPPFWRTTWFYTLCAFTILLSVIGYIRWRERQLRREKEVLETKVTERTFELQKEKEKVTAAHKDIKDSINYAKRIQYALLSHDEVLKENIPQHFILFKPKDIVSGDFYWATLRLAPGGSDNDFYLAVCDSTGHGVPGAFMSLLNISFLNEAIIEKKIAEPGRVFDYVRDRLVENISQDGGKDGMDAILVRFNGSITYAAAHNAPVIIRNGQIEQLGTDKMPVGKGEKADAFRTQTMDLQPGDMVYLYTDGFADQFGGPAGKKFKENNLRKLLAEISTLPVEQQKEKLDETFEQWKGELEQIDDTLVIGFRV